MIPYWVPYLLIGLAAILLVFSLWAGLSQRHLWTRMRIWFGARWARLVCLFRGHETDSRYIHPAISNPSGVQHLFPAKLQVLICHRCGRVDYDDAERRCHEWFAQRGVFFTGHVLSPDAVRRML